MVLKTFATPIYVSIIAFRNLRTVQIKFTTLISLVNLHRRTKFYKNRTRNIPIIRNKRILLGYP